ncbi:PqqD family protein [Couchioplanes caeruleus]|uniref:PqqD family protein n=1 Tax=Couchioplanes caeruleus TaxID=56438 RepID=UPI003D3131D4
MQLGTHPARAYLLDLPDPSAAALLDLLDGTRPERTILRHAAALGVPAKDALALLDGLHEAGLVLPAAALCPATLDEDTRHRLSSEAAAIALRPTPSPHPATSAAGPAAPAGVLRRRRAARVAVAGRGRLAAGIAVALAEAGIGHVHADVPGTVTHHDRPGSPLREADPGQPRADAIAAAIRRAAPTTQTRPVRRGGASLVVQLEYDQPVALLAAGYAQRRQPYLPVAIREGVPVIGPLVRAPGGPCLNCLDLHRRDRETHVLDGSTPTGSPATPDHPEWARHRPGPAEPCAVSTLLAATGYAVGEVLAFIDGDPSTALGAEIELSSPGRIRRRSWTSHPACFCTPGRSSVRSP